MLAYSTSVQLKTVGMFEYGRSESAIQEYHLDEQHYYNKLIGKRASIEDDLKEAIRIYTKKETTS
ncbi:hypothetical protein JCM19233_2916 [Vibrio astriarenae]|nr:hypothetical protein JCM19233_2916 [Vibrio sp. C7]